MFTVTLVHLAPDLSHAGSDLESTFTGVDESYVLAALEAFRAIDPVQNAEADPHLLIESPAAKLLVRTGQGRLFVYNARNLTEPFAELEPAGILRQLASPADIPDPEPALPPPTPRRRRRGLAVTLITLAVALDVYSLAAFLRVRPAVTAPAVAFVTDPKILEGARLAAAGRYTTGNDPGDRVLDISADGHVRFLRTVAGGQRTLGEDTYRVAKHNDTTCLVTSAGRLIDIQSIYAVVYCRDTYRRR